MEIRYDQQPGNEYFAKCLTKMKDIPVKKSIFAKKEMIEINKKGLVLVCNTEEDSLQWLKKEIEKCYEWQGEDLSSVTIVITDYYPDSKIRVKYIKDISLKGLNIVKPPVLIPLTFNEGDTIIRIENKYDERVEVMALSRSYKKTLRKVLDQYVIKPVKKEKQKGRGEKYADRSLV